MTINFPSSPSQGATYVYQTITYTYDGEKWVGSTAGAFNDVIISGNTADVILQGNDSILTDQTFTFNDQGGKLVPYQQGLWTPVPTQGSATIDAARNVWSRIGNTVTLSGYVTDQTSTSSAVIAFTGAPYSGVSVTAGNAAGSRIAGGVSSCYFRGGNDDTVQFLCTATSKSASWVQPKYQDTSTGNNGMYFSVTYMTDDTTWTPLNGATLS